MASGSSPTVRKRQLGMELRRLREAAQKDQAEAAEWLDVPETAISKMERGKQRVTVPYARLLCQLYGVGSPHAEALERLARESGQRGWWAQYGSTVPSWFSDYIGMETAAAEVWTYESELVPGLLQTSKYTEAVTLALDSSSTPEVARQYAEVKSTRQERLRAEDEPLKLRAVVNEAAIRRMVGGPEIMAEQLKHLVEMAALSTVTLQVLPFSLGAHPAMLNAFTALRFPEDPMDTVYVELDQAALYLERPGEIKRYAATFEQLAELALSTEDTDTLLREGR